LRGLKIEYLGRLALALQEQQSDALQRYAQFSLIMEQIVPGFTEEVINVRRAGRRMATTFGLNEGDLNTEEEANAVRQNRQQMQQAQMQMEAMQSAGKAFKDASGKPEAGSPAENLLAQMGV
jgi:membrane protease subunit (stomatin/prohibitin family)